MSAGSGYVWWPAYRPDLTDLADHRHTVGHVFTLSALAAVLCLPIVTRATGIGAASVLVLIGAHLAWYTAVTYVIVGRALTRKRTNIAMVGNLIVNIGVAVAIPIMTHDPRTPLWTLPVVYACLNGGLQERERCITFLLAHALSPLVALIPLAGHDASGWSIGAPILCAGLCATSYNHLASVSARWRDQRKEQEAALSALRERVAARDRQQLATDLQESIGSTLSVVGMYGDLIERHVDRPDELRALAAMVRDAARSSLGDLRGVIGAMAPETGDLAALARTLAQAAERATEGSKLAVAVEVDAGASAPVAAPLRLVIVRAVQDAMRATRRDADARRVDVRLAADDAGVHLEVSDDAAYDTVDEANDACRDERIVARVSELGGTFSRIPRGARGTVVRVALPRSPASVT